MLKTDTLISCLLGHATTKPDHQAVVASSLSLSYAELAECVKLQVLVLNDLGLSDQSVIGIRCADDIQHLILCLAACYLGARSFTIPSYESEEVQEVLMSQSSGTYILTKKDAIDPQKDLSEQTADSGSPAEFASLLFSTSGTTGKPKLVIHYDVDLVEQAPRHIQSSQERFVCLASMEHNFAKRHRLYCVAAGATNIFLDVSAVDYQETLVTQILALNVNVMHLSAFQAQELLALSDTAGLSGIRLKLGGSHVPAPLRQRLRDKVTENFQAGYGTTETGAIAFTDPKDLNAGESVGQALPGIELAIVSEERQALGLGERGELAVKSNGMFRGYLGNPEATDKRLKQGWFYTGDIAYLDDQKRIHLCGRSDDMFVFNSMNIYPQDIESELSKFPDLTDAAVLPKKSSTHGNIPVALVVFAEGVKPNLAALKTFMDERVGLRRPRQFILVDEIPRNASGKIARSQAMGLTLESNQIRETLANVLKAQQTNQINAELLAAFVKGEQDIKISKSGLDSLARMELLVALEIEFDAVLTLEQLRRARYLSKIVSFVLNAQASQKPERSAATKHPGAPDEAVQESPLQTSNEAEPYVVRFFQRIFSYCATVAQLNKALGSLEHRLTPTEWGCLQDWWNASSLLPAQTEPKFEMALASWFSSIHLMIKDSGKQYLESFQSKRISSAVTLFYGSGNPAEKTLVICFCGRGGRQLNMPNTVLMQYTDATRYDLLIISEPYAVSYRQGIPPIAKNIPEMIKWLSQLPLLSDYSALRSFGYSAGAYPSIMAAYRLDIELAVCINGRFLRYRGMKPVKFIAKCFKIWRAIYTGSCSKLIFYYSQDISRDREFARLASRFTGGKLEAMRFPETKVHRVFLYLAENGELQTFLNKTIYAEANLTAETDREKG